MKSLAELEQMHKEALDGIKLRYREFTTKIVVSMGISGASIGAREVLKTFLNEVNSNKLENVVVLQTGNVPEGKQEPVATIETDNNIEIYDSLTPEKAKDIVLNKLVNGKKECC